MDLVSEYAPVVEPIDMSQNRTSWKLLNDEEKSALRLWRGKIEMWSCVSKYWMQGKVAVFPSDYTIYRTVEPVEQEIFAQISLKQLIDWEKNWSCAAGYRTEAESSCIDEMRAAIKQGKTKKGG